MAAARMTAPNRKDSSACRRVAERICDVCRSVSDTWNVMPTVSAPVHRWERSVIRQEYCGGRGYTGLAVQCQRTIARATRSRDGRYAHRRCRVSLRAFIHHSARCTDQQMSRYSIVEIRENGPSGVDWGQVDHRINNAKPRRAGPRRRISCGSSLSRGIRPRLALLARLENSASVAPPDMTAGPPEESPYSPFTTFVYSRHGKVLENRQTQ
jgi:hypothetical protein